MPRQAKGPRIYQHPDRKIWLIRDGNRVKSTGTRNRREAERQLAKYIIDRDRPAVGPRTPDAITVAEVLDAYGTEHAPTVRDPQRIGHCIAALVPILGSLPVSSVSGEVCRRYGKARGVSVGTVRKELGTLRAAINYCHSEGYVTAAPLVKLPPRPPARDRWLRRDEVARLLRAARNNPQGRAGHLCRFILIAAYTGTRSDAILRLRFMSHTNGGWVDTDNAIMYRRASTQAESKKRQPPIPIPRPLLAHMRRWERNAKSGGWVVEIAGQRVGSVKKAWTTALRESGIDHCTRHDLRHTAITWAMQRGMDSWQAAGYFGCSMQMIENVYAHHHPDYLREAAETMARRDSVTRYRNRG